MLAGLRHRAVGGGDDQDRAVHLRRAGDHVLHVVGVAGAVDMRVVAGRGLVLDMRGRDGDAARLLLGGGVDGIVGAVLAEVLGDRRGQRRLAVVHVPDRADVHVRLGPLKLCLRHLGLSPCRGGAGLGPRLRCAPLVAIRRESKRPVAGLDHAAAPAVTRRIRRRHGRCARVAGGRSRPSHRTEEGLRVLSVRRPGGT